MAKRIIFSVRTPIGEQVTLTRDRWREIVRFKHPALSGHEDAVRDCLGDPSSIRASSQDETVYLYYRQIEVDTFVCTVVGGDDPNARFVITAYFTKKIKKGADLWKK